MLWNQKGIIDCDAVVVGTSSAQVKDQNHELTEWRLLRRWWGGVFPDSAISPPMLTSCSSHTEACNAIGPTDGTTSLTTACTLTTCRSES